MEFSTAFLFLGTNKDFTGVAGQVRALHIGNGANGNTTLIQAHVNGDQKADFSIELTGLLNLSSSSFDFI